MESVEFNKIIFKQWLFSSQIPLFLAVRLLLAELQTTNENKTKYDDFNCNWSIVRETALALWAGVVNFPENTLILVKSLLYII